MSLRTSPIAAVLFAAALSQFAFGQAVQSESKGMPPRATPGDYQAHAAIGKYTIAAEFQGHSVATPEAVFSNADFVTVEVGI
ncbi:MAG TPA: hypothetical protein VG273_25165, partial [Bryobacteraceae bacterium]|nr:hypothetical protein [Bryobacteraceae bacterium]